MIPLQGEDGDFGADVEADLEEVADAAADIKLAVVGELKLAGGVAAVFDGEKRRREEGRFALAAMGVAGKDPAAVAVPAREVGGVGIVAEDEGGFAE